MQLLDLGEEEKEGGTLFLQIYKLTGWLMCILSRKFSQWLVQKSLKGSEQQQN